METLSITKAKFGKPVPLLVDAKGYQDGRAILFQIIREAGSIKDIVAEINTAVRREKATAKWEAEKAIFQGKPLFFSDKERSLKEKLTPIPQKEKYSFVAIIDHKEKTEQKSQGTPIELTFPLKIYIEDLEGSAVNNVGFTVTFSDGSKKQDVLKQGIATIEDAPAGKFSIELEGYDFIFK